MQIFFIICSKEVIFLFYYILSLIFCKYISSTFFDIFHFYTPVIYISSELF
nr:MAG TPA: hypothetical protein [Caudoviricetes sp.]